MYEFGNQEDLIFKIKNFIFKIKKNSTIARNCHAVIDGKYNQMNQIELILNVIIKRWSIAFNRQYFIENDAMNIESDQGTGICER